MGSRVTLTRIAEACGVSAMTVSRALRQDSTVKAETRQEVLATARKLGYLSRSRVGRPRRPAVARRQSVEVVVGLIDHVQHPFYSGLLAALERELERAGCDCVLRTCANDYESFLRLTETLRQSPAASTIVTGHFTPPQLEALLRIDPGALLVDNPGHPQLVASYGYVAFDNVEAGRLGTRHLLEAGRRRILLLQGTADHFFSREFRQGWQEALAAAGRPVDPSLIRDGGFTADRAREVVGQALDAGLRFDAVLANDEMACGVLQALHERRIAIPGRIAVVGCDGLPIGLRVFPRLTTVVLDYHALARQAVANLLADPDSPATPWHCRLVPHLVVRDSSVSPR
jgi:LacI family transcriptional regulator